MKEALDMYKVFDDIEEEEEMNEEKETEGLLEEDDNWEWCVSIASSFMSFDWDEYFFATHEEAKSFYDTMRGRGYATLIVDRESY